MVAKAIGGRPTGPNLVNDEDGLESGLIEKISKQFQPLLARLKDRRVLLVLFLLSYLPFGLIYFGAYQDHNTLKARISAQQAVLALPEPRTDDIETGLRSWTAALEAATQAQVLELPDSNLVERLIAAASGTGISIDSISTSDNDIVPVGNEAYDVTPVLLRVSGDIAAIESFIALLEGDAVEALEIQNSLIGPNAGSFTGAIRVLVFNRPVDPSELDAGEREALSRRVSDEELDAAAGASGRNR